MCKKLKSPVKAFRTLILIMVIFQQYGSSNGQIRCFGPVWKTNVFNIDNGYVYVNKTNAQIFANASNDSYLYKISTPLNVKHRHALHRPPHYKVDDRHAFYLFDPNTNRFLCWKSVNGSMVTMNYRMIVRKKHWDLCKFFDHIPNDERYNKTYVNLQLAGHPGTTMQFDRKGRNVSHKRIQKCMKKQRQHSRHAKRCAAINIYLLYYNEHEDCCSEAYKSLCKGLTKTMPELKDKCGPAKACERNP